MLTWIVLSVVATGTPLPADVSPPATDPASVASIAEDDCQWRGDWLVRETDNFVVWSRVGQTETRQVSQACELYREALTKTWLRDDQRQAWLPKCAVVLHDTIRAYGVAIGQPGNPSVGCTTVRCDGERVVFRRIDLRADALNYRSSALPHELTHVVLADRFGERRLAHWADEGIAILSETAATQARRISGYRAAASRGTVYPVGELLRLRDYPPASHRDGFYGQSALLVQLLIDRRSPDVFLDFLDRCQVEGEAVALRSTYGLEGSRGLEEWWVQKQNAATLVSLEERLASGRQASFTPSTDAPRDLGAFSSLD